MPRNTLAAPVLALTLLVPTSLRGGDDPKPEDKDLDGDWEVVAITFNGKDVKFPAAVWTIKGDALTIRADGATSHATIKIDAGKTPKAMDVTSRAIADRGGFRDIYEIKGDELRVCEPRLGRDRPTEFAAKEGTGWKLTTLKRVKK
jgi:uncharacterized protein (TIGR03067 family)